MKSRINNTEAAVYSDSDEIDRIIEKYPSAHYDIHEFFLNGSIGYGTFARLGDSYEIKSYKSPESLYSGIAYAVKNPRASDIVLSRRREEVVQFLGCPVFRNNLLNNPSFSTHLLVKILKDHYYSFTHLHDGNLLYNRMIKDWNIDEINAAITAGDLDYSYLIAGLVNNRNITDDQFLSITKSYTNEYNKFTICERISKRLSMEKYFEYEEIFGTTLDRHVIEMRIFDVKE